MFKTSYFNILGYNQAQVCMSIGSVKGCHIWWTMSIPLIRDEFKAVGCFCHQKKQKATPKYKGKGAMMRERIAKHRQNWLNQELENKKGVEGNEDKTNLHGL